MQRLYFSSIVVCHVILCISVFADIVVLVAVLILVGLFSMQHYGTDKVAFSPVYIYRYFRRGRKDAWTSLGGIMLSITGTEALFADLSHFPLAAIQLAFTVIVFPCLLLAYCGQASYLTQHRDHVSDAFYRSIPGLSWSVI
nr:Potassium transporter 11 [Ipomoea batatas]